MRRVALLLLVCVTAVIGTFLFLHARPNRSESADEAPVVLAAASLQESLQAAAQAWADQGHPLPVLSFAASSALARQVESGAPADLFISADEEWMDTLAKEQLIQADTRATMLGNSLVLIAPKTSTVALRLAPGFALARALGGGRLALADPDSVPAGRYARQALDKLGVWPQVANRIASSDNVRAALALVAQGEAPLGIVYATDAAAEPKVRIVATFPADSHVPITYPVARLKTSDSSQAGPFRAFLLSAEGQAVFRRFGFTAPSQAQ